MYSFFYMILIVVIGPKWSPVVSVMSEDDYIIRVRFTLLNHPHSLHVRALASSSIVKQNVFFMVQ